MSALPIVHCLGLGPGNLNLITLEAWEILRGPKRVFLRTSEHPCVKEMKRAGIHFSTFDHLYEKGESLEEVYHSIADLLVEEASKWGEIIYATPGHPLVAEKAVSLLLRRRQVQVILHPAVSFLDLVFEALQLDPVEGIALLDAGEVASGNLARLEPRLAMVICQLDSRDLASDLKLTLMEIYPPEHKVKLLLSLGTPRKKVVEITLADLDRKDCFDHLTTLFVPPLAEEDIFDFKRLFSIVAKLRGPDGCPWDRKQTHETLARHLIEESHEAIEAIRKQDWEHLSEELGDVLLQVALHAQLGKEKGVFDITDSLRLIEEKLIRRHPHVFGEAKLRTPEEVIARWEKIKSEEQYGSSAMETVSPDLPALLYAYKLQTRAARLGFDWDRVEEVLFKLEEELSEIREIVEKGMGNLQDEIGDLLFSIVNICRHLRVDPEIALFRSATKFKRRFRYMEEVCLREGLSMEELSLEELDNLWEESKRWERE